MRRLRPSPAQTLAGVSLVAASLAVAFTPTAAEPPQPDFTLVPLGTYSTEIFDQSAAEIVAHDPASQRLFVVNFAEQQVDIVNIADPTAPTLVGSVDLGGSPNSVDVFDGLVAVAVEARVKIEPGKVVFLDVDGLVLGDVEVGALPDSLAFTPDGTKVVVANEGEPLARTEDRPQDPEYMTGNDPDGTISVIDLASGLESASVATATFDSFESQRDELVAAGVRINPGVDTVAQDIEPEYVTISADSTTAWVSLQENNAIAEVDLAGAEVTQIIPLGRKDHSVPGNGIDPSDRDPEGAPTFDIRTYDNLYGIHMPDAIDNVEIGGVTYLLTANEGDAREYEGLTDVSRVRDLRDVVAERTGLDRPSRANALCADAFPERNALVEVNELGRLNVSTIDGYDAENGCFFELHALGARSFSIFTTDGTLVFDSGEDFERITHARYPANFNSNHRENNLEGRSDDKGPEPEPITVFELWERTYAMIGFERMGGVITYDISDPYNPVYVDYTNNRNFGVQPFDDLAGAGDLGIEDIVFIPSAQSPNMRPLVVTANEVSGTTTVFEIVRGEPVPPVCASAGPGNSNRSGKVPPPCDRPFPPGRGR
jgi:2',3'-cyclic-nucleotide 2'-phosphodiesterase / 3'-nucleotidase / 5'-nucleotidase